MHNLKRKCRSRYSCFQIAHPVLANSQHRALAGEDVKIERYNDKLIKSLDAVVKAEKAVSTKHQELQEETRPDKRQKLESQLEKRMQAEQRARNTLEKQQAERISLKKGSGKVRFLDQMVME